MSTSNFRTTREGIGSAPLEKEVSRLAKIVARDRATGQISQVDEPEDIFPSGVDDEIAIKVHDELMATNQLSHNRAYRCTYEPDHNNVKLMLKGINMGETLHDYSEFHNDAQIRGEPILVDGAPHDPGLFTGGFKSLALRFNRPTSNFVNQEYLQVEHSNDYQVSGINTGISFFFRVRFFDVANSENGIKRTLYQKHDDTGKNNGAHIFIDPSNQRVVFFLKIGNVIYKKETPGATLINNTVYDIWCTYANSGNVQHVFVNNVDKTLSNSGYGEFWSASTDLRGYVMAKDDQPGGHVWGDFYNFYIYREKVVSASEVTNMWTNKITIYPQALGRCIIPNHWQASA